MRYGPSSVAWGPEILNSFWSVTVPRTHWESDGRYSVAEPKRSAAVLGYIEEAAQETQIHTWTRSLGTVSGRRWQMQLAKVSRRQRASLWACRRSGRDQRYNSACWCSHRENELPACYGAFFGSCPGSWKTVCGWCWVNASKVAKPLTAGFCPSAKVALCTFCKTGFDRLPTGWLALAQVGSSRADRPLRGAYGGGVQPDAVLPHSRS